MNKYKIENKFGKDERGYDKLIFIIDWSLYYLIS